MPLRASAVLLMGLAAAALLLAAGRPADPPNVVLIISDDHGWADYSFMGHPQVRTPNIDRLAAEGLTFRHGHVPSSLCRASLASIINGLHAHQHRITSNDPALPKGKTGAEANRDPGYLARRQEIAAFIGKVATLPRLLGEAGYVSHQSGKWWEGHHSRGGFTEGMTHGDPERGGRHGDLGLRIGRQGVKEVTDFIDAAAGKKKPFFVWYAPMMPHTPHTPPARLLDRYRDKAPSLFVAKYWAMIEWFDETCGQILDHLEKKGLSSDTLVAYVADNGWIQEEAADRHAPKSKRSPNEGGLRTPIILRRPGKVAPRMSDRPVSSIDLAPTVLAACGLKPTTEMQGVNLLDAAAPEARASIFGGIFEHNAVDLARPASSLQYRWVISDGWKLIAPAGGGTAELFQVGTDPWEKEDLAGRHADRVAHLTKLIDAWWPARD